MTPTDPTHGDAAALYLPHPGWAEIVLNRPQRRNAIDGPLADALADALQRAADDRSLSAVVLRGAGGALCSGLDLKAFAAEPPPPWRAGFAERWRAVHVALATLDKVLVVGLERFAINGGAALALAGDLLVCGHGAFLQVGEVRLGMDAPNNLAWLRLRHSEAVAARVALLGDRLDSAALQRLGVATEVVADDEVVARCRALAIEISACPPQTVSRMKTRLRSASLGMDAARWFEQFADPAAPPRPPAPITRT